MQLSIIIPTLNEETALPTTLSHTIRAAGDAPIELIVSDSGSTDATAAVATRYRSVRFLAGGTSRASAMNRGATIATGDVLLFLHADTHLPHDFPALIDRALARPGVVGGAFDFAFAHDPTATAYDRAALSAIVLVNRVRYRSTRRFFGDQAIFVRRNTFKSLGGFCDSALLEDVRFCHRLNHRGRTTVLPHPAQTSPRRFLTKGPLSQLSLDLLLLTCERLDLSPESLYTRYNAWNRRAAQMKATQKKPGPPPAKTPASAPASAPADNRKTHPEKPTLAPPPGTTPKPARTPDWHTLAAATIARRPIKETATPERV